MTRPTAKNLCATRNPDPRAPPAIDLFKLAPTDCLFEVRIGTILHKRVPKMSLCRLMAYDKLYRSQKVV